MNEDKKKRLEAAGFVVGDFDEFATEVLGMTPDEAEDVRFRSDLGRAIRELRLSRKMTQAAFGKVVGLGQSKVARMEAAAPEISLDRMIRSYFKAGGKLEYGFKVDSSKA